MPTYASFSAWSQAKDTHRIYLLTVTGKRFNGTGVDTITRRYATEPYATLPGDSPANTEFLPLLLFCPDLEQSLAWVNGSNVGGTPRSFAAFGQAVLSNSGDVLAADWGPDRHTAVGWDVSLDVTGPHVELAYANRGHLLTGVGGMHTLSDTEMHLELFDNAAKWGDAIVGADELLVANYSNLPVGNIGKTKPVVLGQVFNHEPVLVDDASFVYLVSNENIQAISAVYSNLHALTLSSEYTVQLTAAGGGTFTLASAPGDARITCDVQGRKPAHLSSVYSANKGEIIESLLREDAGFSSFNSSAMTAFKAATHNVGFVVTSPTRVQELVDILMATPRDYYDIEGDGNFAAHVFAAPAGSPDHTFSTVDGKVVELIGTPSIEQRRPLYEAIVSYEHVELTMTESETAGAADLEAKHRVKEPYRTRRSTDAVVLTWAKNAESLGPLLSRLVNSADAATIAAALMSLFGVARSLVRAEFQMQPWLVNLGDVVELERAQLGLDASDPNLWRVVARRVTRRGVELTLFQ